MIDLPELSVHIERLEVAEVPLKPSCVSVCLHRTLELVNERSVQEVGVDDQALVLVDGFH